MRLLTPTPLAGLRHSHTLHCLCLLSGLDIALAYLNMSTPYRPSDSNDGPPGRMLRQLLEEIGRQMTRMLLDALDGRPITSVTLAAELVVRDSA